MPLCQTEGYFENPKYLFLEEPVLFLLEEAFSNVKTKPTQVLL